MPESGPGSLAHVPSAADNTTDSAQETPSIHGCEGRFSCVVDEHPRFHLDALRWFASLTSVAGVDATDLVVHVVGRASSNALDFLKAQGVAVRMVDRFDRRSPHCNKISGALRLAEDGVDGMAILCDTDLAIVEDPRRMVLPSDVVAGKPVDAPVPPLDVIISIFAAAGIAVPPTVQLPWAKDHWTVSGNNNGGLYLVPGPLLERVASAWAHWALWLLDRNELLLEWTVYVDQVAMALCLAAEGVRSVPLDVRWNTPTHDLTKIPLDAPAPSAIHYHQEVDREGRIRRTGTTSIDKQIDVVNAAITDVWHRADPEDTHLRWLSQSTPPEDGAPKRAMLARLIEALMPVSVLEVGCGDGEQTRGMPFARYTGIDMSAEAIRRAGVGRPDGDYIVGALADIRAEADLTICFDLLTQQPDAASYRDLVHQLWQAAGQTLVVSGYEAPPETGDRKGKFFEPLSTTLRQTAPDAEIYPIGGGHPESTFAALRPPAEPHPRDYLPATLAPLVARHPDPLSLMLLRLHARQTTGFYPDHAPRLWEYPVVAGLVTGSLPPRSRLVDVGAGVTPLAPFLTSRGYVIDTVDPSLIRRTWPPQPDWNEWDFLDYAEAGLAHRSWNCTLGELPSRPLFDGAYSVSVIEHVPATDRRTLLSDISTRIRQGGLVVLTIDLVRGRDDLWNRNLGVEVEDSTSHGTFQDVIDECRKVGLELFQQEIVRDWGDTGVDIGLVAMRQVKAPSPSRWHNIGRRIHSRVRRSLS
jgi:2-polyprenyl-3-methyl-5-hydroxy-6-metoxy-1,4-benzoquinol methylase